MDSRTQGPVVHITFGRPEKPHAMDAIGLC